MGVNRENYEAIKKELDRQGITLVAVSKTKPASEILELYGLGQRDFGENYVQELVAKAAELPADISWHFIGHLQTNKVKLILPFVQLVHGVDSLKLLKAISNEATRQGRVTDCLLQVHIAEEETKFGLDERELEEILETINREPLAGVRIRGLMGMASFTEDAVQVRSEFERLQAIYRRCAREGWDTLSMGMSGDYQLAAAAGSTMVRIGSLLFGERLR